MRQVRRSRKAPTVLHGWDVKEPQIATWPTKQGKASIKMADRSLQSRNRKAGKPRSDADYLTIRAAWIEGEVLAAARSVVRKVSSRDGAAPAIPAVPGSFAAASSGRDSYLEDKRDTGGAAKARPSSDGAASSATPPRRDGSDSKAGSSKATIAQRPSKQTDWLGHLLDDGKKAAAQRSSTASTRTPSSRRQLLQLAHQVRKARHNQGTATIRDEFSMRSEHERLQSAMVAEYRKLDKPRVGDQDAMRFKWIKAQKAARARLLERGTILPMGIANSMDESDISDILEQWTVPGSSSGSSDARTPSRSTSKRRRTTGRSQVSMPGVRSALVASSSLLSNSMMGGSQGQAGGSSSMEDEFLLSLSQGLQHSLEQ